MPKIVKKRIVYAGDIHDTQPVGEVIKMAADKNPAGYLPCDGRSVRRSDYPTLFKRIGTQYGAEDDEHFNLPNSEDVNTVTTSDLSGTLQLVMDRNEREVFERPVDIPEICKTDSGVSFRVFFKNGWEVPEITTMSLDEPSAQSDDGIEAQSEEEDIALQSEEDVEPQAETENYLSLRITGLGVKQIKIYKAGEKVNIYKIGDAGTILELFYDGEDFVVIGNPIVSQNTSATEGYTIYSDGYKRQYGKCGETGSVTFPIPFSNANYRICITSEFPNKNIFVFRIATKLNYAMGVNYYYYKTDDFLEWNGTSYFSYSVEGY